MHFKNIKYSKCPYCKKHGLPFYKTSYKYNPVITCRLCGKSFKVNRALSMTILISITVLFGVTYQMINKYWFDIPSWIIYFLCIVFWLVFQYFSPLEEHDEND